MHLRGLLLFGALLFGALLVGCPTAPGDPAIALATGEIGDAFVPLQDGDELLVIQGPQGCCHVNGSVRVAGIDPGDPGDLADPNNPTMAFELLVEGDSIVLDGDAVQGLEDAPSSAEPFTHELIERRVILDILSDDPYDGVDAEFSVRVTDVNGVVLEASVDVVLEPHPFND